ncbi:MAG: hydroxyethylthiazole kinase [Candidatus Dormibacteraeota bacterium]|nr:hydroxyethylthiazole kinase [Candidatus Dormibacteraeota bacterium]MBO0744549.1 hydroxyethylthiazole kinase [Candidatus Dormibacteraeota bacterium]
MTTDYQALAREAVTRLPERAPLLHHLTNFVTAQDQANVALAYGASPVMAPAREEVPELAAVTGALVINVGTLDPEQVESMLVAGRVAAENDRPIVLDPVGAGATGLRTRSAEQLLDELPISVLRGNRGEIGALVGAGRMRGVDAVGEEDPLQVAQGAAAKFGVAVAVTGAVDVIVGEGRTYHVHGGHPLMASVTGTGCMATTAIGAFLALGGDPALQAALALATYGLAADRAGSGAQGPGSFRVRLIDEIYGLRRRGVDGLDIRSPD